MTPGEAQAALAELNEQDAVSRVLYLNSVRENPALANDPGYRRTYNGYYRVRQKPPAFYAAMFSLLHDAVTEDAHADIETLLNRFFEATGERHLSFASKILATATDEAVVYDSNVAAFFGVPNGQLPQADWLPVAVGRYTAVEGHIDAFLGSPVWPQICQSFDMALPHGVELATRRKADLVIWAHVGLRLRAQGIRR